MPSEKGWLGSAGVIGLCTLASRVLGLVRDVMTAAYFGTGVAMDAFVLAFMVPNLFRRLFGEGAMSAAFIPVLTDYAQRRDDAGGRRFFLACFTALAVLLGAISLLAWAACAFVPAWFAFNETWRLFFPLLQVLFPYMPLICLAALVGAALNVQRHFLMPALAPIMLNVCWVAGLLLGARRYGIAAVAVAVLAGGVTQLAMVLAALPRRGLRPGLLWEPGHDGVRRVGRLMAPMMLGLAVTQINVTIDGLIAQLCVPGAGANSALYYGNRLMQFPLAVFGAALATAVFPTLASRALERDDAGLLATLRLAFRVILFVILPATAVAVAMRRPIVDVFFKRGDFGAESAARTASVLMFYCVGLAAYCANQVVTRAFYAFEDTRTPVAVGAAMVGLNLGLNMTLVWPMRESGLALATSLTAFVNLAVLLRLLRRRVGRLGLGPVAASAGRCLAASCACGAGAWAVYALTAGRAPLALRAAAAMGGGGAVFLFVAFALRMPELREAVRTFRRRRRGRRPDAAQAAPAEGQDGE